jgi:hypothetical protein
MVMFCVVLANPETPGPPGLTIAVFPEMAKSAFIVKMGGPKDRFP